IIDAKGRGYGHETMELLEEWSFEDMKFHRGWLDCKDYNERALHVYEAAGLQREALLRETMLVNGKYENLVILAILDREYFARKKSKGE
ncbi:MAG: GNAT family N-acetyltransferase, partial [Schwartzia sp.]|nr:GNAT family N-acetyltransferase [Schwartzia sp. (in: firmicutes)]